MSESFYSNLEWDMPFYESTELMRYLIGIVPFLLVLCCRKSYGVRLCLFVTMLLLYFIDIAYMVYLLFAWYPSIDMYEKEGELKEAEATRTIIISTGIYTVLYAIIGPFILMVFYKFAKAVKNSF